MITVMTIATHTENIMAMDNTDTLTDMDTTLTITLTLTERDTSAHTKSGLLASMHPSR